MPTSAEPAPEATLMPRKPGLQQSPPKRENHAFASANLAPLEIEREMAAARPRLLRLARAHGLSSETAHEVAQETLLEAWRHLDALSEPAGFQVWLSAICRHVCRRYSRSYRRLARREVSLDPISRPHIAEEDDAPDALLRHDTADPFAIDPMEELERHDREVLLDHALGYLAAPARKAVALCYLAELPQREVAGQLGLTIAALEARLHRARRQLRQVLNDELRAEAEAFGLTLDASDDTTAVVWRETRMWCPCCAQHRLHGAFEPLPSGKINLHLRCSGCAHEVNSWGHVPLDGMRTFRPAYKRVMQYTHAYFLPGLESGELACEACGTPQPLRLVAVEQWDTYRARRHHDRRSGVLMVVECPACGQHHAEMAVADLLWTHRAVQRFLDGYPRSITEPETLVEYRGSCAVRVRISAVSSADQLTLLAHPQTLQVLATLHG